METMVQRDGKVIAYRIKCADCGNTVIHSVKNSCTTGYATYKDGSMVCFKCCGRRDRQTMIETGHSRNLPLYLSRKSNAPTRERVNVHPTLGRTISTPAFVPTDWEVTNWPGTLRIGVWGGYRKHNGHNWGLTRIDIWFNGPDGHVWHGYQLGGNTQIVHCKRTKELVKTYHSPEYHQNA